MGRYAVALILTAAVVRQVSKTPQDEKKPQHHADAEVNPETGREARSPVIDKVTKA